MEYLYSLRRGKFSRHEDLKLDNAGYVKIEKGYLGKKPQTKIQLTREGRRAFKSYKSNLQQVLDDLPD